MTGADFDSLLLRPYLAASEDLEILAGQPTTLEKFQDWLIVSNHLFETISRFDSGWHAGVFAGQIAYNADQAAHILGFYRTWSKHADRVLAILDRLESEGHAFRGTDEYRRHCREARGLLTSDAEFFAGDALVALRDEAIDEHREGRTVEFHELGE